MSKEIAQRYAALVEPLHKYFNGRFNRKLLEHRLAREGRLEVNNLRITPLQRLFKQRSLILAFLYTTLTRWWGQNNALDLGVTYNTLEIQNVPPELQGYRILHLSDLHIDAHPEFGNIMAKTINNLEVDLTLITGDFRSRTFGSCEKTIEMMQLLAPQIPGIGKSCFGILGNHDSVTLVPQLERMGIHILMNESVRLPAGSHHILLSGVDDPFLYQTDDLDACLNSCHTIGEQTSPSQLLSQSHKRRKPDLQSDLAFALVHTPQLANEASASGYALYLTGHTHGGQVCWPWGKPVDPDMGINKAHLSGNWKVGEMPGYTSRGSGTSIVDVRFFCPPEVTVHTLVNAP